MATQTIGALFGDSEGAKAALSELLSTGFTDARITQESLDAFAGILTDAGALGPDVANFLVGLGMSHADASYFANGVARGGALVTLKSETRVSEAMRVLQRHKADLGAQGQPA